MVRGFAPYEGDGGGVGRRRLYSMTLGLIANEVALPPGLLADLSSISSPSASSVVLLGGVRDPIRRIVSEYRHEIREGSTTDTLGAWVARPENRASVDNAMVRRYCGHDCLGVESLGREHLERALANLAQFQIIYAVEAFDQVAPLLRYYLGWEFPLPYNAAASSSSPSSSSSALPSGRGGPSPGAGPAMGQAQSQVHPQAQVPPELASLNVLDLEFYKEARRLISCQVAEVAADRGGEGRGRFTGESGGGESGAPGSAVPAATAAAAAALRQAFADRTAAEVGRELYGRARYRHLKDALAQAEGSREYWLEEGGAASVAAVEAAGRAAEALRRKLYGPGGGVPLGYRY